MKTLLIDCDGVLYPSSALSMKDFITAVQQTSAQFGINEERYQSLGKEARDNGARGVFNFMSYLAKEADCPLAEFKEEMLAKLDYSKIKFDEPLKKEMIEARKKYNLAIVSNNMRKHVHTVFHRVFHATPKEMHVRVLGIEDTERKGVFYPKQTLRGIRIVCRHLGKELSDCILFDDTAQNLETAAMMGLGTVLITPEKPLIKALRQLQKTR